MDKEPVVMVVPDLRGRSTSTIGMREVGESDGLTARALLGFLGCILVPLSLWFNPVALHHWNSVPLSEVMAWLVLVVTGFALVFFVFKQALREEATFLPVVAGAGLYALLQAVGQHGTIGLVTSGAGWVAIVALLIVVIATIALMLDGIWEPFAALLLAIIVLTWLAQVSNEEAHLAIFPMFLIGGASFVSAIIIWLQESRFLP